MINQTDTIVAVSSPPGRSLRGLVRLSGDDVVAILAQLGIDAPPPRTLTRARLDGLPVLVTCFRGPRSYTGQDMAEIQLPGNPALLDRMLHRIKDSLPGAGVRLAAPGEFTARAFLAGKMDLPQAEGVAASIAAVSDSELAAAKLLREGRLGTFAAELVDELADALALVEAGIDFTDQEDVVAIPPPELVERVTRLHGRLADLLAHSRVGAVEALPRVVLVARSAGKSTLFNALLGRARTVVIAQPGTTRDVIAEPMTLPGDLEIMLVDIAGLDAPRAALDHDVQAHGRAAIAAADLVLHIDDGSGANVAIDHAEVMHVRAKADLGEDAGAGINVSALTGLNVEALRDLIARRVGDRAVSVSSQMLALQPRHEQAIRAALDHLAQAIELAETHGLDHVELVAGACRAALDELAGLGGQMTPDDVIGRVFSRFCIGK